MGKVPRGEKGERMKKLSIIIVLIALVGAAGWAQSGDTFGNGKWLHNGWIAAQKLHNGNGTLVFDSVVEGAEYMGYVIGVKMAMEEETHRLVTIPTTVTNGQIFAVVGSYVNAHPEQWDQRADIIVEMALTSRWPYGN